MKRYVLILLLATLTAAASHAAWPHHTIDDSAQGADGVRLVDVNGDGLLDIATAWEEAGEIRVYLHPGLDEVKQPWQRVTVGTVRAPEDAVFTDLDGDGVVDVVSSCEGSERTIYFHWAPQDAATYLAPDAWSTVSLPASADKMQWMYCLPLDMDGDGDLDLVAGAKGEGAAVGWFERPESPRDTAAWKWHHLVDAGWIMSIEPVDMNHDGRMDLLISDRRGPGRGVYWLENGNWRQHRIGTADTEEVMFLAASPGETVKILCGVKEKMLILYTAVDSASTTWQRDEFRMPENSGTAKGAAFLSEGEQQDWMLFSCEHANGKQGIGGLAIDAAGKEAILDISGMEGAKFDQILLNDVDGDGDLDLLTTEEREGMGVVWYENPAR